jgi:hypothetical protein
MKGEREMKGKKTVKWTILITLLALVLALASSTMAAPPMQEPESIECGDSITCSTADDAVYVENAGTGPTIHGHNTSTGEGLKGRGNPGVYGFSYHAAGVRGKSNQGIGVKAESVDKYGVLATSTNNIGVLAVSDSDYALLAVSGAYRGAQLRSVNDNYPDLVLGANSDAVDNGTIYSEPSDADSDLAFYGMDKVHIHLDEDNNTTYSDFSVYNGVNGVAFKVDEAGNTETGSVELRRHIELGQDETHGSVLANGTNSAELYLIANGDIYAELDNNDDDLGRCFIIRNGDNVAVWTMCESKGMTVSGSVVSEVDTGSGSREVYAMSSPENWFEDFGSGELVDGRATISVDPLFAETVNLESEYHVYLTPMGDCNGLYVTNQTAASFEVRELGGGTSGIGFHYRIVAKRLGYEGQRLEQVPPSPTAEADS